MAGTRDPHRVAGRQAPYPAVSKESYSPVILKERIATEESHSNEILRPAKGGTLLRITKKHRSVQDSRIE